MASPTTTDFSHAPWPTTLWPLIRDLDSPEHKRLASEVLASRYWRPVYAFLRHRRLSHHDAADRTQDFFLALFEKDWALRADETKGRFRTFLITLLKRYVRDLEVKRQADFEKSQKSLPFTVSESDARLLNWKSAAGPAEAFWLQYVRDLLDRVIDAIGKEASQGQNGLESADFELFLEKLHSDSDDKRETWADLGLRFQLNAHQARYRFHKIANRLRELLSDELGETSGLQPEFEASVAELFKIIRSPQT